MRAESEPAKANSITEQNIDFPESSQEKTRNQQDLLFHACTRNLIISSSVNLLSRPESWQIQGAKTAGGFLLKS